ncbi:MULTISPECIES: TetR family transcriptional regulator C-terminal domain-containing protein [unclassified Vibrio]|uniref:TetR family transcriptional regulator C-terminal domain-containing protein n=1 Tax=Vibrio sp. HB236076 TaxID=3232307 RepID=A0AB39HF66_9VIBR|nr:TetR family transcriptional regulator C-terminal domain-containing protein [Vibrio sp. HB161653]MDP5252847.1 TetR family transcriptional regulator C-terminal domain-containing protein [Vibrio sp. HB161653]
MEIELVKKSAKPAGEIRRRNREKIILAATDEFVKNGFKGTSVQGIADSVNLPKANVLYYFKSKTGLYKTILQDIVTMWNEGFAEQEAKDDPFAILEEYIVAKMRYSRSHPKAAKIFAQEIIQGAPIIGNDIELPVIEWTQSKANVIQAWVEQGKIKPVEPLYLLFMIWGTTQFYADYEAEISLIKGKSLTDDEFYQAERFVVETIIAGLKPQA